MKGGLVGFDYEFDPCDRKTRRPIGSFLVKWAVLTTRTICQAATEKVSILAREPGDAPCGCWVKFPVISITKQWMSIVTRPVAQNV